MRSERAPWAALVLLLGCRAQEDAHEEPSLELALPVGFPQAVEPDGAELTESKLELGRRLFYDKRLSLNESQACASCHQQALAFTDGRALSAGSTGQLTQRSSMSLGNVGYAATLTWANDSLRTLEEQVLVPLFGEDPVELGFAGKEAVLLERLRAEPIYRELFARAFPGADEAISLQHVAQAIAAFERTLISGNTRVDRYRNGEMSALDASEQRGLALFFSERFECFHCHGGFNYSSAVAQVGLAFDQAAFENNGLYNLGGSGAYPEPNRGLYELTGDPRDMGKFKPPSLRNVAITAPYMHDGSLATLEEVLEHYAAGGRSIADGPLAGDGRANPNKSRFVRGFVMPEEDKRDLLAFLRALTDEGFLRDPSLADPWTR
jgi:cytochrome c peroxidase